MKQFREDTELAKFVRGKRQFLKITYENDEDVRAAFVKACLSRGTVVAYQKERLQRITTRLSKTRAESAFGELETELNQLEPEFDSPIDFDISPSSSKSVFKELDQEISLPEN